MSNHQKTEYVQVLKKSMMFRFLSDESLEEVFDIADVVTYGEGERIITEGEISPYFYLVLHGGVHVLVQESEEKEVFISAIGEGECFGEAGIFITMKRTAHIVTTVESTFLRIHRESFLGFIKKKPAAGIKMLMVVIYGLLKKLRSVNQELAFERKSDLEQDDIDDLIGNIMKEEKGGT